MLPFYFGMAKIRVKCFLQNFLHHFPHFMVSISKFSAYFCYINMSIYENTKLQEDTDNLTVTDSYCSLIVWNDEVNTFEWVIDTLVEICGHSTQQAEQCAIIIDSKGKYAVKQGSYDILKPQCGAITERGINATIEVIAN
jgi:ATP-dependent Clp protease adaptor protein ClpS